MPPLGLYVHVPFCAAICGYCTFNRGPFDPALKTRYVAALATEIRRTAETLASGGHPADPGLRLSGLGEPGVSRPRSPDLRPTSSDLRPDRLAPPDTLYFGGGTPSLLEPLEVAGLVETCREAFALASEAEVTLEANPETLTPERVAGFRRAGVTRMSLGVQSFLDAELRRLGRLHTVRRAEEAVAWVRAAGTNNVSLDLMMWLPGQSLEDWVASLDRLVAFRPAHASLYLLELHSGVPLGDEMARAGLTLPPEEVAASMYERAIDCLEAAGYEHYEISNFALPGYRSRHNLKYWTDGEWVGFGCSAHSTLDAVRWESVRSAADYVARIEAGRTAAAAVRRLTPDERLEEALFMRLRLLEGIDLDQTARSHGVDVWARYGGRLRDALDAGLLTRDGARLRLTRRGLMLSNEVMAVFIEAGVR